MMRLPGVIKPSDLDAAIRDAADRLQRDETERGEAESSWSTDELQDAVWGRLPVAVRRKVPRDSADVAIVEMLRDRGDRVVESIIVRYDNPD